MTFKRLTMLITVLSAVMAFAGPSQATEVPGSSKDAVATTSLTAPDEPDALTPELPDVPSSIEEELYFSEEEMVTGPAGYATPVDEAPANIFVITHEDIIQSGQIKLPEVLRRVPGMDVIFITTADTQASMRGFANPPIYGTRMSVLIDGRIYYSEFLNAIFWNQLPVPLDDIKRIEVIKGPMSSLYGNKAMLGIINIVTYDPEETQTKLGGGGGMYRAATGEFVNAGRFSEDYWYKVTGSYVRSDDYNDWRGTGKQKAMEIFTTTGKFLAKPTDSTRLSFTGGWSSNTGTIQFGALARGNEKRGFLDLSFDQGLGNFGDFKLKTYWERLYSGIADFPALPTFISDFVESEARHTIVFDVSDDVRNTLVYGFDYRFGDMPNQNVRTIQDFAGFVQDEFRFFDQLIFTGGARVDYQRNFAGLNIAAHGSLVYLPHPLYTFRVGFGSAFNNPNYFHYYTELAQGLLSPGAGMLVGNRNLKAEKILYLDVGNTFHPIEQLEIHADFFYYRLNSLISPVASFFPTPTAQWQNDGGAEAIGGEIAIEGQITKWLEGYANWSYQDFDAINGNLDPTPNLGNAKHKVNTGLRGTWFGGRFTANLDFSWVYRYYRQNGAVNFTFLPVERIDDIYLLNARLAYWPIKDHLELAVAANNILNDNDPQTPTVDPTFNLTLAERPRFNLWGSIRYVF
jgi:iron complex outermembrane receptor protein